MNKPAMLDEFMYALMKEARRYSFVGFLEIWGISEQDYKEIEKWFKDEAGIKL
jgi:hypothetical protein